MLKINNIFKNYHEHVVINGITLEVKKNEILGLAGSSGSGKTTLLRCIQKLENIDSGSIECNEETVFMFQDFQLFPHMNVMQNLLYAPLLNNIEGAENSAMSFLKKLNIEDKAKFYPSQLSGGQKQRVALARSLMMHPSLLLCDEPTSGLDVATINDVVTLLVSVKNMGVTMIIASHNLDFLLQISDRIVLIKDGTIAIDIYVHNTKDPLNFLQKHY